MASSLAATTSGRQARINTTVGKGSEEVLKRQATSNILDYEQIKTIEQLLDQQSIVVAETQLVALIDKPTSRYSLQIVELRNEATLRAAFHEISVLKKLDLHPLIMGLFMEFRHRQYIGFLRPAFFTLRDKIDIMHKFKKSGDSKQVFFRHPYMSKDWAASFSESYAKECLKKPGVFGRDAVAYTVTHVIAALDFLNSKNLVHTNISSASVFVNERSFIKLGSFLHVRRIGSSRWDFTGNPGILPPEAFQEFTEKRKLRIKPNFDTWAIGLFVLEMITGKRMHYSRAEMAEVANKFLDGTLPTPTLEETDPNTVVNGMQIYDPNITDFLAMCFALNCETRAEPSQLLKYKFLNRTIDTEKAQYNLAVESQATIAWNTERSLRLEMLTVHTYYAQLKEDLMQQIRTAIRLVHEQAGIPIFDENLDKGLARNEYVVIEASLAFILDEDQQDWSTDVLDVSNATTPGRMQLPQHQENKTPSASGEQIRRRRNFNNKMERDYQRCELIFFVNRKWSNASRQLFVALMFARWFDRDLISFPDLIRVVDELDDILTDLMLFSEPRPLSPYKHQTRTAKPDSVAFVTGLRRSLIDPESKDDPDTHRYNNIYVEVALNSKLVKDKKIKMHRLREGDPVNYPDSVQPLYAAATFYQLNVQRLNTLDAVLLGERRVKEWEYLPDERITDPEQSQSTMLTTLLMARRQNPNAIVNSEIDWELSNQARRAKLWGDYRRDFMFRFAKYAVPYQLDHPAARAFFETPVTSASRTSMSTERFSPSKADLSEIEIQLARTRSKQEEDIVAPFKYHDDVEMRQSLVEQLLKTNREKDEHLKKLEEQLANMEAQLLMHSNSNAPQQSPSAPRMEEYTQDLGRLPKNK